jgi:hypothetical protein
MNWQQVALISTGFMILFMKLDGMKTTVFEVIFVLSSLLQVLSFWLNKKKHE